MGPSLKGDLCIIIFTEMRTNPIEKRIIFTKKLIEYVLYEVSFSRKIISRIAELIYAFCLYVQIK